MISNILCVLKNKDNALNYLKTGSLEDVCSVDSYELIKELVEDKEIFY